MFYHLLKLIYSKTVWLSFCGTQNNLFFEECWNLKQNCSIEHFSKYHILCSTGDTLVIFLMNYPFSSIVLKDKSVHLNTDNVQSSTNSFSVNTGAVQYRPISHSVWEWLIHTLRMSLQNESNSLHYYFNESCVNSSHHWNNDGIIAANAERQITSYL